MKPKHDLDSLIKKHKEKSAQRFPVDSARVRESVFLSIARKPQSTIPCDFTHVSEHIEVTLQNKRKE